MSTVSPDPDRSDPPARSGPDCSAVVGLLPLFVGEDLAVDEARIVSRHLRDCPRCRRAAGSLLQAVQRLRRVGSTTLAGVGPQFFADLQRDIELGIQASVGARSDSRPRWVPVAALAAAAALAVTVGLWFAWPTSEAPWPSLLHRPAIPVPHDQGLLQHGRAELVPVGLDKPTTRPTRDGSGMGGRLWLRDLEQDDGSEPSLMGTTAGAPRPTSGATEARPK